MEDWVSKIEQQKKLAKIADTRAGDEALKRVKERQRQLLQEFDTFRASMRPLIEEQLSFVSTKFHDAFQFQLDWRTGPTSTANNYGHVIIHCVPITSKVTLGQKLVAWFNRNEPDSTKAEILGRGGSVSISAIRVHEQTYVDIFGTSDFIKTYSNGNHPRTLKRTLHVRLALIPLSQSDVEQLFQFLVAYKNETELIFSHVVRVMPQDPIAY